jgi:hypothetical protein
LLAFDKKINSARTTANGGYAKSRWQGGVATFYGARPQNFRPQSAVRRFTIYMSTT